MNQGGRLHTKHVSVDAETADAAVSQLRAAVDAEPGPPTALLVFCSPAYDLDRLGDALKRSFDCPIVGCTTAGQLGPKGFQPTGLTAVAVFGQELALRTYLVPSLDDVQARSAQLAEEALTDLMTRRTERRVVGLLLADGLSMAEERLAASLHQALDGIPIVGGSAGDDLRFQRTAVYFDGRFLSGAATLTLLETSVPFVPFKFQHFEATGTKLVITEAEPEQRLVREINGEPAAEAYAEAVGVTVQDLTPEVFSKHPVMLRVGDDYYVRSIQKVGPAGALVFYCAIEEGLVLTIGRGLDPVETARRALASVAKQVGPPSLIIGCDCVLRRLEVEQRELAGAVGRLFADNRVVGFSTYGEQFNGLHINQTFTGVAFGS